jgi:Zn-dependent protease
MLKGIITFIALLIAVIIHEIAHGYIAFRLGDNTAKNAGRLTLNPIPHLDPLGSILLPALLWISSAPFFIGWAKPVPVNSYNLRNPEKDLMLISIAGPAINITLAVIFSIFLKLFFAIHPASSSVSLFSFIIFYFLNISVQINVILALFNLIPLPPLDGSKILFYFLPSNLKYKYMRIEPYGFVILFILVYLGLFQTILTLIGIPIIKFLL